ncbi:MAG: tRNA guanosine(34) transglycosylase Tgt [Defluviitaleaceae bacterium]|nr:tRNA guanosine(34) transglycosylase Tgt [Defluviitaleaceae bacterium]
MYTLLNTEGRAKRAVLHTVHGDIQTPVFMNVATAGAIKGALSALDLQDVGCQVALANTYHLHLRPGDALVRDKNGIRSFMAWDGPLLTDSGGFQVFSLANLRKIKEEGVHFSSHIDGRKIFMGPEESMEIQSNLASTIAMAFDECPPHPAERDYMKDSVARTTRWLLRSQAHLNMLNQQEGTLNKNQLLFGINQGGVYEDIRIAHAKEISELNLDGYAIGGLAVGETHSEMYRVLEAVVPHLPQDKPTYLMGVGTPENLLESIDRGIDFFDCVLPARNGRHGHVYTSQGKLNFFNAKHERDDSPLDPLCGCQVCRTFSRAYIRHLFKAKEMLAMRLCVLHNLYFYNHLMADVRDALAHGKFQIFKKERLAMWGNTGI